MKKLILTVITFIAFANVSMSQSTNSASNSDVQKVIVMVNTASWCPTCRANGKRVEENVISNYKKNNMFQIIINDLSNKETKAISKVNYTKAGISEIAKNNKGTGVIYFIDAKTKKLISQISIAKTNNEISKAFDDALSVI